MDYSIDDLDVIQGAHEIIRRHPDLYAGPSPRAARLADALMRALIVFGDVPAIVDHVECWWVVASAKDWVSRQSCDGRDYWNDIVPTPEIGPNSMRPEVVLRALSEGLVTATAAGLEAPVDRARLPAAVRARLEALLAERPAGRVVAFRVE